VATRPFVVLPYDTSRHMVALNLLLYACSAPHLRLRLIPASRTVRNVPQESCVDGGYCLLGSPPHP